MKKIIVLITVAVMLVLTAVPAQAADKYAKTVSDIDKGSEFVLISAKYKPSGKLYAFSPDTRAKYLNWSTITPYKASTAAAKKQVCSISRYGNVSHGYGYHWENIGTYVISMKGAYDPSTGSAPDMALTDTGHGIYWEEEIYGEYDDDGVVYEHFNDLSQRWYLKKIGTKDGKVIFRFTNCKTGNYLCGGGHEGENIIIR